MSEENLAQTLSQLAERAASPRIIPGIEPFLTLPDGHTVESLEQLAQRPSRKRATPIFTTLESFVAYVNAFKGDGRPAIFSDSQGTMRTRCIFDYHEPGENGARWGDHSAVFQPRLSEQWRVWVAANNRQMAQSAFVEFLEDNARDIATPPAAEMLDIAGTLQATMNVKFRRGVRLADGTEQLTYEQNLEASAGQKGQLTVPTKFSLSVPVFEGEPNRSLEVRLRYKITEGELSFRYLIARQSDILREQWLFAVDRIAEQTGIKPFAGSEK